MNTQWEWLIKAYETQRLPHALLLTGIEGSGKLQFAREAAQFLLCDVKQDKKDQACHACRSCHLIQSHTHPDYHLIQPEQAGDVIKIDVIRELIIRLQQTSHLSTRQIVIIEPAEQMNTATANALLKTLEEPAGEVIFILVSHQFNFLPMTIRSRCQQIAFPPRELSQEYLAQQANFFHQLENMLKQQTNPLTLASWCIDQTSLSTILSWLMYWTIEKIRLTIAASPSSLALFAYLDQLMLARRQIQEKINLNQQLLVENLLCRLVILKG